MAKIEHPCSGQTEFNMATLQQQVQQHLQNTGISLRELAKQAGIGKSTVALVVSGRSNPSIVTRRKLQAAIRDYKPQTLDATVEQLAAQCVNADLTHVRDDALECAKYRRVMALEAELDAWQLKCGKERDKAEKLQWSLNKSEAFALVVTKDLQIMQASWKAACVQVEQLQKQLDHGQAAHSKLYNQLGATRAKYETQLEVANQKEVQLQEQLTGIYATKTRQEAQIMRLRAYVWILIAAIVLLIVSGLVVWGGV